VAVNLKLGVIELSAEDTKTEEPRTVFLTSRVREALEAQPRHIKSDWVFINPDTEEAWKDIRKVFRRACKAVKLTGVWFHDLRRSFVTNARRRGVPESVVMGAPRTASFALARPGRHGTSSIGSGEPPSPWISRNRGHPSLHAQSPEPASTATCSGIDQARPHHGTG